ncbi:MAG: DNA translocase FtsK 4TM domain-containing protein [Polyangiaceae bacterium]
MALPLFAPRRAPEPEAAEASQPVTAPKPLPANLRMVGGATHGSVSGVIGGARVLRNNVHALRNVVGPNVAPSHARGREAIALILWTAALFVSLALWSFAGDPAATPPTSTGPNWVGPVGEAVARVPVSGIGLTAWALPLEMMFCIPLVRSKPSVLTPARFAGDMLIVLTTSALIQVGWPTLRALGAHPAAGLVGELFGELSRSLFSTVGSFIVGFAILGLIPTGRAAFSFIALMRYLADFGARGARGTAAGARPSRTRGAPRARSSASAPRRSAWRRSRGSISDRTTRKPRSRFFRGRRALGGAYRRGARAGARGRPSAERDAAQEGARRRSPGGREASVRRPRGSGHQRRDERRGRRPHGTERGRAIPVPSSS